MRYTDFYAQTEFALETGARGLAGTAGLGSEWDRAWNGAAWVPVGQGGALQADRQPDRVFLYRFTMDGTGDQWVGSSISHSTAFAVGDTLAGAEGHYTILREVPFDGPAELQGMTWVFGYYDGSADTWLASYKLNNEGGPSGLRGIGSEYDYAWNGSDWDDFGLGGQVRASMPRDSLYAWMLTADNGDRYGGWLVDDEEAFRIGDTLRGRAGTYRIDYETTWGGAGDRGKVWTTYYWDQPTGRSLETYLWGTLGGVPAGQGGLGSEYDYAWDGDEWDDFGVGGIHTAGVIDNALFQWTFTARGGDRWTGWMIADATQYAVGDTVAGAQGTYRIVYETQGGPAEPRGTVWTTDYFDTATGATFGTYLWAFAGGQPSGRGGLGSEYDYVWDGDEWDDFGSGGNHQVRVERDMLYSFVFRATGGDIWGGLLLDDFETYAVGDVIARAQGSYTINSKVASTWAGVAQGAVFVTSYYDAGSTTWLTPYYWNYVPGVPGGRAGLGSEYDWAWDGDEWDDFGQAGLYQADVERNAASDLLG